MNAEIIQFLTELRQNNNREWFQANKSRYDSLRKGFIDEVQQLIDRIALFDPEIAGLEAKDCLFRIYRDIRFSPDKTPYKIHFAAYMASCGGRGSERAGYYIHLEPSGCLLSGGVWCPPPALLKALRKDIYENIEDFVAIMEKPSFKKTYPTMEGEVLNVCLPAILPISNMTKSYVTKISVSSPINRMNSFSNRIGWIRPLKISNFYIRSTNS